MQHSQRLDQRLHMLRDEVRAMTREKERGERVWRERLQRCQRQVKAKEEEMSRQSQYFENFKTQLQHKLSLGRDREQSLQSRIYTLEKRLLDMTVSAATGMATIRAVRTTAGTVTLQEEQERLTSMRGEGEGEEERKEERMKQLQTSVFPEREGGLEGDEGQTEKEIEGGGNNDTKPSSDESRLRGFILSLQQDLRVLLERGEDGMTERRGLMEQLTEAQENGLFLGNRVEEMKAEVHGLKLSESSLMEEVEELREENDRLQLVLREAANQTASQNACTSKGKNSVGSSAEVQPSLTGGVDQAQLSAVPPDHHQSSAEIKQKEPDCGSKHNLSFQALSLTSETVDEFNLDPWCCRGILDLEQSPSEESDALREAWKSLGLGEDLADLREQRGRLEAALQHTQDELKMVAQENTQLKIQLRQQAEERAAEQGSSREMIGHAQSSPPQDNNILTLSQDELTQDDLAQALNQENRALAERIEELLAHIELGEVEIKKEQSQLREHASRLEEVRVRLEQENQEQGCLITELTRKTEDDLNTIMELQQKLAESGKQSSAEECVDNTVERIETQSTSSTQTDGLISVSATGSQHNNQHDLLQNSQPNTLHVSALKDQVCPLTKTVQSLKTEQDELIANLNSLREQQGEVAQSVQTKTEEKQQLTRAVWGLKEEKDRICQCLAGLRQEREQLTRTLCGLKDNRDHFISSMSGLKEEKEQLTKTLSSLEREKEDHLSGEKEEQDQIKQSLQSLQTERDQLGRAVLSLKQEREDLTTSIKCLKEQRDQEQSSHTLEDDCDKLMKSLSSLRDEKERVEHSITRLRHEEEQIALVTQSLREERQSLLSHSHSQTQTQERNQRRQNPNTADPTEKIGTGDAVQRCQTNINRGKSVQEQRDLLRETEVLGSQLKTSQEELDRSHVQAKKLQSELCQSEARREEAERTAAEKGRRLTDVAYQIEETRSENKSLSTQVKELQSKVTGLLREKSDALLLNTQIEEQYDILTAQLKAKTVALDELNSEYITLKRGQGIKHEEALMSVHTRYNDIRAKYDALLKKRSQTDLDLAPLKAKVSCLVVKCQERNNFLAKMMKTMHRHGCADSTLNQQVELLLSDAALRDYTAAFTPGGSGATGDYSAGFTPRFTSTFIHSDCPSGSIRDQSCPAVLSPANELTPEAGRNCRDFKSDGQVSISTASSTNIQDCRSEVTRAATATPMRNTSSPVQEKPEATTARKESSITSTAKLGLQGLQSTQRSLSPGGLIQATGGPETFGFHPSDVRGKSSPDLTSSTSSSLSPTPPPSTGTPRRLSSPEKILNLHEQLQRTLMSSYQAPVSRGRGQEPRKSLSFSVPADLNLTCQTNRLSFNKPHINSLPVTAASNQTTHAGITTKPATTLFNAVASRSAHVSFSPSSFTHHHFKASALSGSSNESKSPPHSGTDVTVSRDMAEKLPAVPNTFDRSHTTPVTPGTNRFDSNVSICSDTNLKSTASDTTAPGKSTAPECNISNGAAHAAQDRPVFTVSWTQSGHRSPERPNWSARKSTAAGDQTKSARPRPDAPPAEVRSVEVIQTVGQSSLMIGWERPPLDELGCSNGTFVYGYRLLIDGDFHKSVMSSACTKCIAENVDLSVPIHISVQTLGSNGLSSNSVHTVFRKDHH